MALNLLASAQWWSPSSPGVSLQNSYTSWEQYSGGSWGAVSNFTAYKNADPDDIRMKQGASFHVRAIKRAVIQQVSVLPRSRRAPLDKSGGELTITNSNSNFGGCATFRGYQEAPPQDTGYSAMHQRVPTDLSEETNNIRRIYLGTIASVESGNVMRLSTALTGTVDNEPRRTKGIHA